MVPKNCTIAFEWQGRRADLPQGLCRRQKCCIAMASLFNSLTVVNQGKCKLPREVYKFLRNEVLRRGKCSSFPCVEPKVFRDTHLRSGIPDFAAAGLVRRAAWNSGLRAHRLGRSIRTIGAILLPAKSGTTGIRDIGEFFVNHFENAVSMWMERRADVCLSPVLRQGSGAGARWKSSVKLLRHPA